MCLQICVRIVENIHGWNACHGGHPLHVIECIGNRECPVVWTDRTPLLGYARERVKCTASNPYIERAVISSPRRIPESEVKTQIIEYGCDTSR